MGVASIVKKMAYSSVGDFKKAMNSSNSSRTFETAHSWPGSIEQIGQELVRGDQNEKCHWNK